MKSQIGNTPTMDRENALQESSPQIAPPVSTKPLKPVCRSKAARPVRRNELPFALPREHGATVCLVLASILALKLTALSSEMAVTYIFMSLILFSVRHKLQAMIIGAFGFLVMAVAFGQPWMGLTVLSMGASVMVYHKLANLDAGLKQTFGIALVSMLPFIAAGCQVGFDLAFLVRMVAFVGCALLGVTFVQLAVNHHLVSPTWSLFLSMGCLLAILEPATILVAKCLIPFGVQILWLSFAGMRPLKEIGIAQTLAMMWCTVVLWLY
jgi:hypothetical protein